MARVVIKGRVVSVSEPSKKSNKRNFVALLSNETDISPTKMLSSCDTVDFWQNADDVKLIDLTDPSKIYYFEVDVQSDMILFKKIMTLDEYRETLG